MNINSLVNTASLNLDKNKTSKMEQLAERSSFDSVLDKTLKSSELGSKKNRPVDKKLMDTCVEMESIFVARMLKEMRKNVQKTGWIDGGMAENIFEDMLYDEYAHNISKNSRMGMADMLYKQLSEKV